MRWDLPAHVIERRIRAVTPNPGAWTMMGDMRLKLGAVTIDGHESLPAGVLAVDRTGYGSVPDPIRFVSVCSSRPARSR